MRSVAQFSSFVVLVFVLLSQTPINAAFIRPDSDGVFLCQGNCSAGVAVSPVQQTADIVSPQPAIPLCAGVTQPGNGGVTQNLVSAPVENVVLQTAADGSMPDSAADALLTPQADGTATQKDVIRIEIPDFMITPNNNDVTTTNVQISNIPEPFLILTLGLGSGVLLRRRKTTR